MVRTHPQWVGAVDLVRSGRIGPVRSVLGYFSYYNRDLGDIRNVPAFGGGGLMDIGCYLIVASRLFFGEEPTRVSGAVEVDPETGTDVLTSAILAFPSGQSVFTCSTQVAPYQRVHVFGETGRVEIEVPFNAPNDRPCRVFVDDETIEYPPCDQYTIQGDLFSKAVLEGTEVLEPLEDSIRNMECIEAVFRSSETGRWERP